MCPWFLHHHYYYTHIDIGSWINKYVILLKIVHTNALLSFKKSWQSLNIFLISSKLGEAFGQWAEYQPTIWYINNYHPASTIQRAEAGGAAGAQLRHGHLPLPVDERAPPSLLDLPACLFSLWRLRVETITQSSLLSLPRTPSTSSLLASHHLPCSLSPSLTPIWPLPPPLFPVFSTSLTFLFGDRRRRDWDAHLKFCFPGCRHFGDLVIWARG